MKNKRLRSSLRLTAGRKALPLNESGITWVGALDVLTNVKKISNANNRTLIKENREAVKALDLASLHGRQQDMKPPRFINVDVNYTILLICFINPYQPLLTQFDFLTDFPLPGFGLSLVDSTARREVAYMAVTSSGVSWEMQRKKRFKRFKPNDSIDLEVAYQKFLTMIQAKGD